MERLKNYNTLSAVLGAFTHQSLFRMTRTMAEAADAQRKLETMRQKVDSRNNYREYRALIEAAVPPAIPFMGVLRKDLIYIDEGNTDWVGPEGELVNWEKREMLASVARQVQRFQGTPYTFPEVHRLRLPLLLMPGALSDEALLRVSLEREP